MKRHARIFIEGLLVIVPVALTVYLLGGAVLWIDRGVRDLLGKAGLGDFPGLGVAAGLVAIYLIGLLAHLWLLRRVGGWVGRMIEKLPLVKTLYGALKDLLSFLRPKDKAAGGAAVKVDLGDGAHMIGITTGERDGNVGVYLPMSYQLGGFLVYVPRERMSGAGMDVESAIKHVITGGMGGSQATPKA